MQEILVWFLGQEDPLEKVRLPTPVFWPGEFHGLYSPWGRKESGTPEQLSLSPVVLPGQFHRQKSLMGYSPWGHKGLDMTECIHAHTHTHTTYATRRSSGRETSLLFLWSLCALRKDSLRDQPDLACSQIRPTIPQWLACFIKPSVFFLSETVLINECSL